MAEFGGSGSRGGAADPSAAEASRLRAENARLRKQLEGDDALEFWKSALLSEVAEERVDERRIFCLKSELSRLVAQNRRLGAAARARHAALERLAGSTAPSAAHLEAALADGGAETLMATQAGAAAPSSPSTLEAALEAEQKLSSLDLCINALSCLAEAADGPRQRAIRELRGRIISRAAACRVDLLQSAADLPLAAPHRAACARRYIHRALANIPRTDAPAPGAPAAAGAGSSPPSRRGALDEPPQPWQPHLPEGLVVAWREALEASAAEGSRAAARPPTAKAPATPGTLAPPPPGTEECVAQMVEHVAAWVLQLREARAELASCRASRPPRPRSTPRKPSPKVMARSDAAAAWD